MSGSLEKPEQFTVVDDHTFRVTFLRKDKLTMPDIAVPVPVIINSELARKHATPADPWAMEQIKTNDAGGGAFKVESWGPGQESVYVRFDDWKSGPLPKLKKMIVREVPQAGNRRAPLDRGDADISFDLPPKDFAEIAEVTAAFRCYEEALNDNDVTILTTLFWTSPLTIRFGIGENLYGHDAITDFRRPRPNVDLRRTLANTVITTYGADFATANTEFVKRDTGRRGPQSQTWMRTEAGWRVVSAHVSFLPAQD